MNIQALALATILLASVQVGSSAMESKGDSVSAHMPRHEELGTLKRQAMAGSGNAALSVALWHMKFPDGNDTDETWTRIAAENGSPAGQFNLGLIYARDQNPLSQLRARYWLERAEKSGNPRAREELLNLSSPAL